MNAIELRLHLRHVGLGNAILLELPDNRCGVVDWGTTDRTHHDFLLDVLGDRELAFVAATHGHEDHTAGLPWLFRQMVNLDTGKSRIRNYVIPLAEEVNYKPIEAVADWLSEFWTKHPRLGSNRDVELYEPSLVGANEPPVLVKTDRYQLVALHPPEALRARAEMVAAAGLKPSGNRPSLVLLLQLDGGKASILFGGDAEEPAWNFVRKTADTWPAADPVGPVTVVSHHGASSRAGMPQWAIKRWTTGGVSLLSTPSLDEHHPAKTTLKTLCDSSKEVYCTSYAEVCGRKFRGSRTGHTGEIVHDEPCFGNLVVTVRSNGSWEVTHDGPGLREWGYCGN